MKYLLKSRRLVFTLLPGLIYCYQASNILGRLVVLMALVILSGCTCSNEGGCISGDNFTTLNSSTVKSGCDCSSSASLSNFDSCRKVDNSPVFSVNLGDGASRKDYAVNYVKPWKPMYMSSKGVSSPITITSGGPIVVKITGKWSPWATGGNIQFDENGGVPPASTTNDEEDACAPINQTPCSSGCGDDTCYTFEKEADNSNTPCYFNHGYGLYILFRRPQEDRHPNSDWDTAQSPVSPHIHVYAGKEDSSFVINELIDPVTGVRIEKIPPGWEIYAKIIDNFYCDNYGGYQLQFIKGVHEESIGAFFGPMDRYIRSILGGVSEQIYKSVVSSGLVKLVHACIILFIILNGLYFALGLAQISLGDIAIKLIKIGLLATLISPGSWDFFYSHFLVLFTDGMVEFISIIGTYFSQTGQAGTGSGFDFLDEIFLREVFSPVVWTARIPAFMLSNAPTQSIVGDLILNCVYILPICLAVIIAFVVMIYTFCIYLSALIGISLLIALFPLCLVGILFSYTKKFFQGWLKMALNFLFQAILSFSLLFLMISVIQFTYYRMLGFTVCCQKSVGFYLFSMQTPIESWNFWTAGKNFSPMNMGIRWDPPKYQFTQGIRKIKVPPYYDRVDWRYVDLPFLKINYQGSGYIEAEENSLYKPLLDISQNTSNSSVKFLTNQLNDLSQAIDRLLNDPTAALTSKQRESLEAAKAIGRKALANTTLDASGLKNAKEAMNSLIKQAYSTGNSAEANNINNFIPAYNALLNNGSSSSAQISVVGSFFSSLDTDYGALFGGINTVLSSVSSPSANLSRVRDILQNLKRGTINTPADVNSKMNDLKYLLGGAESPLSEVLRLHYYAHAPAQNINDITRQIEQFIERSNQFILEYDALQSLIAALPFGAPMSNGNFAMLLSNVSSHYTAPSTVAQSQDDSEALDQILSKYSLIPPGFPWEALLTVMIMFSLINFVPQIGSSLSSSRSVGSALLSTANAAVIGGLIDKGIGKIPSFISKFKVPILGVSIEGFHQGFERSVMSKGVPRAMRRVMENLSSPDGDVISKVGREKSMQKLTYIRATLGNVLSYDLGRMQGKVGAMTLASLPKLPDMPQFDVNTNNKYVDDIFNKHINAALRLPSGMVKQVAPKMWSMYEAKIDSTLFPRMLKDMQGFQKKLHYQIYGNYGPEAMGYLPDDTKNDVTKGLPKSGDLVSIERPEDQGNRDIITTEILNAASESTSPTLEEVRVGPVAGPDETNLVRTQTNEQYTEVDGVDRSAAPPVSQAEFPVDTEILSGSGEFNTGDVQKSDEIKPEEINLSDVQKPEEATKEEPSEIEQRLQEAKDRERLESEARDLQEKVGEYSKGDGFDGFQSGDSRGVNSENRWAEPEKSEIPSVTDSFQSGDGRDVGSESGWAEPEKGDSATINVGDVQKPEEATEPSEIEQYLRDTQERERLENEARDLKERVKEYNEIEGFQTTDGRDVGSESRWGESEKGEPDSAFSKENVSSQEEASAKLAEQNIYEEGQLNNLPAGVGAENQDVRDEVMGQQVVAPEEVKTPERTEEKSNYEQYLVQDNGGYKAEGSDLTGTYSSGEVSQGYSTPILNEGAQSTTPKVDEYIRAPNIEVPTWEERTESFSKGGDNKRFIEDDLLRQVAEPVKPAESLGEQDRASSPAADVGGDIGNAIASYEKEQQSLYKELESVGAMSDGDAEDQMVRERLLKDKIAEVEGKILALRERLTKL